MKKNTFVGPLTMACIGLSLKIGLKISNTYGPIKMLVISVIGMSASVLAASFMDEFVGICNISFRIHIIQQRNLFSFCWNDLPDGIEIATSIFSEIQTHH